MEMLQLITITITLICVNLLMIVATIIGVSVIIDMFKHYKGGE